MTIPSYEIRDGTVFLRVCSECGVIMVSNGDIFNHGIRHSNSLTLSPNDFKYLLKLRREGKTELTTFQLGEELGKAGHIE